MNIEGIIRMAREAGYQHRGAVGQCDTFAYFDLERFAALVAAAEREECAKVCDGMHLYTGYDCAEAIRARGQA